MVRRCLLSVVATLVLGVAAAAPAHAQYFGRNAVQWERLRFEILKTEHFDVHYYPEESLAAQQVGRMAERWHARLSRILDYSLQERQPIILYASQPQFQQTQTVGGPPGEGTGGVTEAFKRRVVLPVGASLAETDHVLGHELVHAFQYAMTGQGKISSTNFPGVLRMPLWFVEGMAEYLSVGPLDAHTAMWIRDASRREKLPTIRDLDRARYFPYRYGHALWSYLAARFGDSIFANALRAVGPRSNDGAFVLKEVLAVDDQQLSKDWHAAIREANAPIIVGKQAPATYGRVLVNERQGGELNVGPALSPDGTRLAFLSERERLSVELFVADVRSGQIQKRLSRTVTDPHLESLQFISSAGSWDHAGQRLALGAVAKGRPLLLILDAGSGETVREIPLPGLGEIHTPTFAPDDQQVAFSALVGGFSDLFLYDLRTDSLRRLTDDTFADLQPDWSPDGRTIVFVSDRFTTALPELDPGPYRLATIDVSAGEVRALPTFEQGKSINPQWAPSGRSLYFVSDAGGISNLFRLDLGTGERRQLTDLVTGVSGITPLSPAVSAASGSDTLAYSVFEEDKYRIYTIDQEERLAGWPARIDSRTAAVIPGGQVAGAVVAAREDPGTGLAEPDTFESRPYKPKLGLDYVGQPYVGAGVDRYGTMFSGGISLSFSDMLGEHTLDTVIQAERVQGFTDFGAIVAYVNKQRRFNWGVQLSQVPYLANAFGSGIGVVDDQLVYQEVTLQQRQIDRSLSAIAYYPFDLATRVEVQAGFRNIGFKNRLLTDTYAFPTGEFLGSEEEDLPGLETLNLGEGAVALVRDTSVFGATSPILGQRFRLEAAPVFGSLNYVGALADLRQYVQPFRPLTLAGRVMHYGRYGSSAEDPRLLPLFLGYQSLVRGYDSGSFTVSECGPPTEVGCPIYDQLLGSRLLVMNAEARFPLFALFGARSLYGPIPIEIGAFFDAGVAWDTRNKPALFGGEREMVKSVGLTGRLNLFGYAVLQLDWAKPLDRPGKKPFFQFSFLSGF